MIAIKLREAMQRYLRLTEQRHTYATLADVTGISKDTLSSIGSHRHRNPSLGTIEKICVALCITPDELLELDPRTAAKMERKLKAAQGKRRKK